MKHIITLLLACLSFSAMAGSKTFDKLYEVNKCWQEQKDVDRNTLPAYTLQTEKEWIKKHLMLVEQTLRARSTAHLTPAQKQNRLQCLDYLNQYWHESNFPINDRYSYRTPIFIDQYNNFCAVGYLVKASGNENISRMIAAKSNLAYVRQMNYPELFAWAYNNGFSEDELAWIQPAYPPVRHCAPIGKGTNGEIFEMFADNVNGKLYVGGNFSKVDSTITANNIAYVTENNGIYTWHSMGTGVNGPVYAITEYNNKIYVAGSFTQAGSVPVNNVAYWDGSNWHDAGCLFGKVNDLVVYNNQLYAGGHFDVCASLANVNFAHWNGTYWQQHPGLTGPVNTMEVVDNDLILGGNFTYGSAVNIIKWDGSLFQTFTNGIVNEVNDIEKFGDTVYAVCTRISATDSNLVYKLNMNTWTDHTPYFSLSQFPPSTALSFKTLCAQNDTLMTGGDFLLTPLIGNYAQNCYSLINPAGVANWFNVDSAINKMVIFKGELIAGGKFKYGNAGFGWSNVALNGITRKSYTSITAVPDVNNNSTVITIYPNPAATGEKITIQSNILVDKAVLLDLQGRSIATFNFGDNEQSFSLPFLASGTYMLQLSNTEGQKTTNKIIIK